jgi:hypothetical protein
VKQRSLNYRRTLFAATALIALTASAATVVASRSRLEPLLIGPQRSAVTGGFTHPLRTGGALPFGGATGSDTELWRPAPGEKPTPLSEAARLSDGSVLYSRDVNRILCMAERGTGIQRETWLGTRSGVKCIDRKAGVVRHYTRRDGLPGDTIVALAADRDGVWCLVTGSPTREPGGGAPVPPPTAYICALDAAAGRWNTLRDVPGTSASSPSGYYTDRYGDC